jgi:hypothetical protein
MKCTITDPGERRRRLATVYQCLLQANHEVGERVSAYEAEAHKETDKHTDMKNVSTPIKAIVPI